MRKALSSVLYSSLNNILSSSDITSPTATSMLLSLRAAIVVASIKRCQT